VADLGAAQAPIVQDAGAQPRRIYAWLALAAGVLTLAVIVASAIMRHAQAGLSCADWPACYGSLGATASDDAPGAGIAAVRAAHRIAATGVLALIVGMLLVAWAQRPVWKREAAGATAATLIVAGLAVLGVYTAGAKLPAIVLGNLAGGIALLAVLSAAHATAVPAPVASAAARRWALLALALAFAQVALGGMIGAQFASLSCPGLAECGAWSWREFLAGGAWDPRRVPVLADGRVVAPAGAAALHMLHRLLSVAIAAAVLITAQALRPGRAPLALARGGALSVLLAAGLAAVAWRPTLAVVVLHNGCAALLVALCARAAVRPPAPTGS
jgi:cytochrome c oxidase assembly protein subunit 15